jgi:glucosamine--fructose-6-phosphate aminotransferase (isomerizing)
MLHFVASWQENDALLKELMRLPDMLEKVLAEPAQLLASQLANVTHLIVLGRGFGYAISCEIALKLKEVCGIQAESYSSAEFLHGPVTLAESALTVIGVEVTDESSIIHQNQLQNVESRGASLFRLTHSHTDLHPRLCPLLVMLRFYLDVEAIAIASGINPDAPPGLNKVTQTL